MADITGDGLAALGNNHPGTAGEQAIQQQLGTTEQARRFYQEQVLDHLNERMREFVRRQEMFFLATSDRFGECDSSFRAGPPGFLRVLDPHSLVYPEYRGNGVHASLGNISENPHAGLLLIDFERARIGLHINGRARIVTDEQLRADHPEIPVDPVPGRQAQVWVRIHVLEAYIHGAAHIPHLVTAPKRTARDWGTQDYRRRGGDFFATRRGSAEQPRPDGGPSLPPPSSDPAPRFPATPVAVAPMRAPAGAAGTDAADGAAGAAGAAAAAGPAGADAANAAAEPAEAPEAAEASGSPGSAETSEPGEPPAPRRVTPNPVVEQWRAEAARALAEAERRGRAAGAAQRQSGSWFGD